MPLRKHLIVSAWLNGRMFQRQMFSAQTHVLAHYMRKVTKCTHFIPTNNTYKYWWEDKRGEMGGGEIENTIKPPSCCMFIVLVIKSKRREEKSLLEANTTRRVLQFSLQGHEIMCLEWARHVSCCWLWFVWLYISLSPLGAAQLVSTPIIRQSDRLTVNTHTHTIWHICLC